MFGKEHARSCSSSRHEYLAARLCRSDDANPKARMVAPLLPLLAGASSVLEAEEVGRERGRTIRIISVASK